MRWEILSRLLLLGAALALAAQSRVRIVHVSYLHPGVEVSLAPAPGAARQWAAALLNAPVAEGEGIRTGASGFAEVQLECGSALRLAPDSGFGFTQLRLGADGVPGTTVEVGSGTAFFNVRRLDSRDFHVTVAGATLATPDGAARFQVEAPPASPPNTGALAAVEVTGGKASLQVGKKIYVLKKSDRWAWTAAGGAFQLPLAPQDAAATWNQNRDRILNLQVAIRMQSQAASSSMSADEAAQPASVPVLVPPDPQPQDAANETAAAWSADLAAAENISNTGAASTSGNTSKAPLCAVF